MASRTTREPAQITLTVFAARDLQSKRKGEVCQASVVFGLGKNQYVTEMVEDNNPEWNQEAVIAVSTRNQNQSVKFKVRDKEHTLGVVILSLTSLGSHRESSKKWLPLTPHKKGHEVTGELLIECFVSQYRPGQVVSLSETSSPKTSSPIISRRGSQEDILHPKKGRRFSLHRRNPSWSKVSPSTESPASIDEQQQLKPFPEGAQRSVSHSRGDSGDLPSSSSSSVSSLQPQVTGVSPHEGPVQGGQRVVLRGSNLGESKESVVKVLLADVDCTSSLEYFSPTKLAVTTPPRHAPCRGYVQVETVEGGLGKSSIEFAFIESEIAVPPEVSGVSPREGVVAGGQRVILRGSNLGECKEGVVRVVIADVDCTETLEYFSPAKLAVTTLPRPSPGSGEVLVETARGGVSKSNLTFTYVAGEPPAPTTTLPSLRTNHSHNTSRLGSFGNTKKQEVDPAEVKMLKQQIKDLRDDNVQLRERNQALMGYIDTLLLNIIEKKPDILEVKSISTSANSSSVTVSN